MLFVEERRPLMCAESRLKWFACLFGSIPTTSHRKKDTRTAPNRTVIVLTAKPLALRTLMNASEEKEIADAAEKARKLLGTRCEAMFDDSKIPKRFEMLCAIGPISDYDIAKTITQEWIKSRGPGPRAAFAEILAARYELKFSIDLETVYALANIPVKVKVLSCDEHGTYLEIRPKRDDEQ